MGTKTIGIKQLHRELGRIAKEVRRGSSFLVVKRREPVFRIEPVEKGPYTLSDIRRAKFRGDRRTSKKIDRIVYGGR